MRKKSLYERYVKRGFDVVVAGGILLVTWPLLAVIAIGVRVFIGGSVIYRQQRITRGGEEFTMLKFKSMRDKVDVDGPAHLFHTDHDDPRHTEFGKFIRRFSLDELPQMINVLRGEMSVIGPRPELPDVCRTYGLLDHPRHEVRPGLTGAWQVSTNRHSFVHLNTHLDADYVANLTFRRDAQIFFKTFGVLVVGKKRPRVAQTEAHELISGTRALRVLHVLEPSIGGVPAYVDQLGRILAERGIPQLVVTSEGSEWDFAWAEEVIRLPWSRRRPQETAAVADEIRRLADTHRIDLVHAHATFAGIAARLRGHPAPVVFQPHGWGHLSTSTASVTSIARGVEKVMARRTDLLLTLSRHEELDAPDVGRSERVLPLPELGRFLPPTSDERCELRRELGWGEHERIHLCVGEFSARKNQAELVREFDALAPHGHRLVLIGDGDHPIGLPEGDDTKVEALGWRTDVERYLQAADSLVISSRGEGFSLVVLEALATGLPVFTTDIGGAEVIGPEDGAVEATVRGVVAAATTSPLLDATVLDRRTRSKRHTISAEEVGDRFVGLYESLFPARSVAVRAA